MSPMQLAEIVFPKEMMDNLGLRLIPPRDVISAPGILYEPEEQPGRLAELYGREGLRHNKGNGPRDWLDASAARPRIRAPREPPASLHRSVKGVRMARKAPVR